MADMLERSIPASQVPTDAIRCPRCKGQNITLKGYLTREFTERLQDGQVVEQKFADALERETKILECNDCQIRHLIMTQEEYALSVQNMQLNEALMAYSPNYIKPANKVPC
jgi:DNA-directed RNA polymerase subunit RPC12/RpoP